MSRLKVYDLATGTWVYAGGVSAEALAVDPAFSSRYVAILGVHSLATSFTTTGTHTSYQDEGLTLTLTPNGHRMKFTLCVSAVMPGGAANVMTYRLLAGATTLHIWNLPGLSATDPRATTLIHTETLPASGPTVFKIQVAGSTNWSVQSFGSALSPRQLIIEDLGVT